MLGHGLLHSAANMQLHPSKGLQSFLKAPRFGSEKAIAARQVQQLMEPFVLPVIGVRVASCERALARLGGRAETHEFIFADPAGGEAAAHALKFSHNLEHLDQLDHARMAHIGTTMCDKLQKPGSGQHLKGLAQGCPRNRKPLRQTRLVKPFAICKSARDNHVLQRFANAVGAPLSHWHVMHHRYKIFKNARIVYNDPSINDKRTDGCRQELGVNRSRFLPDILGSIFERRYSSTAAFDKRPIAEMCEALLTGVGEVSGLKVARAILTRYGQMDASEKEEFFRYLTDELDVDTQAVETAAKAYAGERTPRHLERLTQASEPRRQELLRRINQVPGATAQLVAMRLDMLDMFPDHTEFGRTDLDFIHLFTSWFNRGFLVLRRIDWDTPANILEKIIEYEAVHAIDDWDDLRRRIEPEDRHCFGFFHPVMPEEPLIFVEVALSKGVPGSVQTVLAEDREILAETQADTAVFYSISNCQRGLRGISFGNSLIKQVVEDLSRDLPQLKTFVTLSPIPRLVPWLEELAVEHPENGTGALLEAARTALEASDPAPLRELDAVARYWAASYLVEAKRDDGRPLDPVARFHLGNGALVHDVHAMSDVSANGLRQSCGVMVNYLYDLDRVEQNHEEFVGANTVAQSRAIQSLLRAGLPDRKVRRAANG